MKAGGGGAASSTWWLTLELRRAHHVALIQPPLQSNASPHSHTTCAFPPETAGFLNHFMECAKLETRKATEGLFSFSIFNVV